MIKIKWLKKDQISFYFPSYECDCSDNSDVTDCSKVKCHKFHKLIKRQVSKIDANSSVTYKGNVTNWVKDKCHNLMLSQVSHIMEMSGVTNWVKDKCH